MKMATVTEHANIFCRFPHRRSIKCEACRGCKAGYVKQPALLGGGTEREDGEAAKLILGSVKQSSFADQAPCLIAVLKAI